MESCSRDLMTYSAGLKETLLYVMSRRYTLDIVQTALFQEKLKRPLSLEKAATSSGVVCCKFGGPGF